MARFFSLFLVLLVVSVDVVGEPLAKPEVNNCSAHDPQDLGVPLCPESGDILPPWYPAAAITIAEDFSLWSPEAERAFGTDRKQLLADTVEKFWKAQPGKPPQVFLNGSPATREWLIKELARRGLAKSDAIAKGITLNPDMVQTHPWTWQQDMFQESFDAASGRPIMREITPYFGRGTKRIARTTIARMQQQCGLKPAPSIHYSAPPQSGFAGGNIEGFPGGLCVVGSSDLSRKAVSEYFPLACGEKSKIVEIDTGYLSPGHVDEFVAVVPNRKKEGSCAFAILVASPLKAVDVLQAEPEKRAFHVKGASTAELENRIEAHGGWTKVCSLHHQIQKSRSPEKRKRANDKTVSSLGSSRRSPASDSEGLEKRRAALLSELRKRIGRELMIDQKFDESLPRNYFRKDCAEMTNADVLNTMSVDEGRRYPAWDFNMTVEAAQMGNVQVLREAIQKQIPGCNPEIIAVPQIFQGKTLPVSGSPFSVPRSGSALNPPPTNGVLIGNRYFMPDPMNESMREYNRKVFEKLGLELEFVDTYSLHRAYGNLHCATNVARYCRPRGAK